VYLSPGRYALRPTGAGITVVARRDGWTLATATVGTLTVEYDVVDTAHDALVLHDRVTLSCASAPLANGRAVFTPRPSPAPLGVLATGPSVSPVRSAAQVDGRGLPIAVFAGELPSDGTLESPTPWVRSHVSCTGGAAGGADRDHGRHGARGDDGSSWGLSCSTPPTWERRNASCGNGLQRSARTRSRK